MGWEDRHYYRDRSGSTGGNPLMWLLTGSVSLFTAFGIHVRAHASLFVVIVLALLFRWFGDFQTSVTTMTILFGIVLLHEFGHCFAARWVGGDPREILMWPLGGLAYTDSPQRPWPRFVTVAGGPLVNVAICAVTAGALLLFWGITVGFNPFFPMTPEGVHWQTFPFYLWWIFFISYWLLLFNLLPIFPLDGGQLAQIALWPRLGYVRSMNIACVTGMVGSVALAVFGLVWLLNGGRGILLIAIGIMGFIHCMQQRRMLRMTERDEFQEILEESAAIEAEHAARRRRLNQRALKRARRLEQQEQAEQIRIDAILAKVSAHGMHSLNWWERRTLRKATERQRERDLEFSRGRNQ